MKSKFLDMGLKVLHKAGSASNSRLITCYYYSTNGYLLMTYKSNLSKDFANFLPRIDVSLVCVDLELEIFT